MQRADALYQLDGRGGMGHYVARQAMDIAVAGARRTGVAAVAVHDANFFGAAAYYVDRAARAGCVGLAFGNSFPKVVAHGGRHPVLGTNPLAVGAPRADGATFLLDMATSAVAGSTVRRANERGQPLGQGDGVEARGPAGEALLLPLAGAKGFGLALAVEILAGVLTGAGIGHGVRSMYEDLSESGHNGQLFVALDVETLMPLDRFCARMEELAEQVRASGDGLRLPGELRTDRLQAARREGVAIAAATRVALASLAASCGVRSPW